MYRAPLHVVVNAEVQASEFNKLTSYLVTPARVTQDRLNVLQGINGVVVTWVVAIDPPGVRFPLNADAFVSFHSFLTILLVGD